MTPEAARLAKGRVDITPSGQMVWHGSPVHLKLRYATLYFEILVKGCLYWVPSAAYAWYWHRGTWPAMTVKHINGDKHDFCRDNLKQKDTPAPKVLLIRRLSDEEKRGYTGIRAK